MLASLLVGASVSAVGVGASKVVLAAGFAKMLNLIMATAKASGLKYVAVVTSPYYMVPAVASVIFLAYWQRRL